MSNNNNSENSQEIKLNNKFNFGEMKEVIDEMGLRKTFSIGDIRNDDCSNKNEPQDNNHKMRCKINKYKRILKCLGFSG